MSRPRRLRQPGPLEPRFWGKVDKTDGCWFWRGYTSDKGYGRLSRGGNGEGLVLAHRLSWELAHGPIPDGAVICHRCDVRNCVRPNHLFIGSQSDNVADAVQKGRHKPPSARKLSAEDAAAIRERIAAGEIQRTVAADFGVNRTLVSMIVNGHRWKVQA